MSCLESRFQKCQKRKNTTKLYWYWETKEDASVDVGYRQKLYEAGLRKNENTDSSKTEDEYTDELYTYAEPDEFLSPYGLIDKQGNYYSCGFGGHNAKAFSIIKNKPARFGLTKEELYAKSTKELDILVDKGWIVVHNPNPSGDPYFSIKEEMVATKWQINTAFDYMAHFNRKNMGGLKELMKNENL